MKILPVLFCMTLFITFGCGKNAETETRAGNGETQQPGSGNSETEIDCTLATLDDYAPGNCRSVSVGESLIAGVLNSSANEWTFVASRRSGGPTGTKWFNSEIKFEAALNLSLPMEITAEGGKAGNGHKLYIRFNDTLDCAWYSHANVRYRNPRCFINAERTPGTSTGFTGGSELIGASVSGVVKVHMSVNGSSGSNALTRALAIFQEI